MTTGMAAADAPSKWRGRSLGRLAPAFAALLLAASPLHAADDAESARGAAVTVLKASKTCFSADVDVYGFLLPKNEVAVRTDRLGARVLDVAVEPGETVTSGQIMARLVNADGTISPVAAPVAGLVGTSSLTMGGLVSPKGEALFTIISRSEFDLIGLVPTRDLARLKAEQPARIKIAGAGEMTGRVVSVAATVEPNTQLGQVTVAVNATRRLLANASARAIIKTGESCGVSLPLTAILYGEAGTVVQVVRRQRIETRRVEIGLMSGGRVEIREGISEGDEVVARAGAMLREGDAVRPVVADPQAKM
jgi:multidrug efflux pump subunit AcrA (membrane-fusion protein)